MRINYSIEGADDDHTPEAIIISAIVPGNELSVFRTEFLQRISPDV